MKHINEVIIVEGKTDTQVLKSIYDVDTIETHGLALNDKTISYIQEISKHRDIIILTDPDFPGNKIRHQIEQALPTVKHAFVNKKDAIKNNKVGIAETNKEAIIEALNNTVTFTKDKQSLSWEEFVSLDIIGHKEKRQHIYDVFHLGYGNNKTLFKRLNMAGIKKTEVLEKL